MKKTKLMLLAGATIITAVIGAVAGAKSLKKVEEEYKVEENENELSIEEEA